MDFGADSLRECLYDHSISDMYAEGTDPFVGLESRHSMPAQTALGEQSYGQCQVLE